MKDIGKNMVFRGEIGAGCMFKAQAKEMVKRGHMLVNTARGISSVVGTLFTWPTTTALTIH